MSVEVYKSWQPTFIHTSERKPSGMNDSSESSNPTNKCQRAAKIRANWWTHDMNGENPIGLRSSLVANRHRSSVRVTGAGPSRPMRLRLFPQIRKLTPSEMIIPKRCQAGNQESGRIPRAPRRDICRIGQPRGEDPLSSQTSV